MLEVMDEANADEVTVVVVAGGADTSHPVGSADLERAARHLRGRPIFWGRYFKHPRSKDPVQYQHARENGILASHKVPVLPIARQTNHVGGTEHQGRKDALDNAKALIEAFGRE